MSERISNRYKSLFEVQLLHHYWLDEGGSIFDLLTLQKRQKRLLTYDIRPILAIAPTFPTAKALQGYKAIYRNTALGFIVAVPNSTTISAETVFEFTVTVRDPDFFNYTALTLQPQSISEHYSELENKVYRCKANVAILSNSDGVAKEINSGKHLFLSRETPALADDDETSQVESLLLSGDTLLQLTSDQPNASRESLTTPASQLPVFMHQGDLPDITMPSDITDAPKRGIRLSTGIPDSVFALIRLAATRPDDDQFSFVGADGRTKANHPTYHVRFKNRLTKRWYINKSDATVMEEPEPLPLTYFGDAGTRQKPSPEALFIEKNDVGKVIQLVSIIYV